MLGIWIIGRSSAGVWNCRSIERFMGEENDDLDRYVNLFGYNPKYGITGSKNLSVKYLPQGYDMEKKLYEV